MRKEKRLPAAVDNFDNSEGQAFEQRNTVEASGASLLESSKFEVHTYNDQDDTRMI